MLHLLSYMHQRMPTIVTTEGHACHICSKSPPCDSTSPFLKYQHCPMEGKYSKWHGPILSLSPILSLPHCSRSVMQSIREQRKGDYVLLDGGGGHQINLLLCPIWAYLTFLCQYNLWKPLLKFLVILINIIFSGPYKKYCLRFNSKNS